MPSAASTRWPTGLLALAVAAFGIGLTEFVIAGLLPEVGDSLGVDQPTAGWLVTGYAIAVAVGAVLLTAATTRLPRKATLLGLLVLFVAGNLLSAVTPDFGVMLLARVIAAFCHGSFFGIGSVVAAGLVPPERRAAALALMFSGLTLANVLGVPLGTLVGQAFGWRATFWAITVIGVAAFIGVALLVPQVRGDGVPSLRRELAVFRSSQVWLTLTVTALGFGGVFGAFTYIASTLTRVSGFPTAAVPWLLVLFGVGLFAGNLLGARFADRAPDTTLLVVLATLTAVLALFAATAANPVSAVIGLLLMGGLGFAIAPAVTARILAYTAEAPTLASGANVASFNVGNASGAAIGGVTIALGSGFTGPLWSGAVLVAVALLVMIVAASTARRRALVPAPPAECAAPC